MLHFLLTAESYLNFCCIKSNLFLVTDARYERDGAEQFPSSGLLKKRCAEKRCRQILHKNTADGSGNLVEMSCFLVFVFNTLSEIRGRALVIFALRICSTGILMQDHTGRNKHGDLSNKQTTFTDQELETYLETLQLKSSKNKKNEILNVTFVLNGQMRQCGELQIHSGRRKIPHPKLTKRD